jgi:hypothetical protein
MGRTNFDRRDHDTDDTRPASRIGVNLGIRTQVNRENSYDSPKEPS